MAPPDTWLQDTDCLLPGPPLPTHCGPVAHLFGALIEMVAKEPSASLGQLGTHLAHIGQADALKVLSKLG